MSHHLHVHTIYSAGDALGSSDEYAQQMPEGSALAITDHNTMAGVVDHHDACHKHDLQPIYGMEVTLACGRHLTLLAMNETGYRNLCRMVHQEVTRTVLADHAQGVICLTGDLNGPLSVAILRQDIDALNGWRQFLIDTFGDRLYYELIDYDVAESAYVNRKLRQLGPTVQTNDVHYPDRDQARAHALLMADKLDKYLDLEWALYHGVDTLDLCPMPDQEVADEIVRRCTFELPVDEVDPIMPDFQPPDNYHVYLDVEADPQEHFLLNLAIRQLKKRTPNTDTYWSRLRHEWEIVCDMGYAGYYLIVWDFIDWAHRQEIPVGPGRGSGAGSLLAYVLKITDIDPIEHGLLFERFLNPERVSMPDFDIDFAYRRREEVIDYVTDKYGAASVSGICTYGTMKAKEAWHSAGRPLGFANSMREEFSSRYLPDTKQGTPLAEVDLEEAYEEYPEAEAAIEEAQGIEGSIRSVGRHAAGLVITPKRVEEYAPLSPEDRAVQYDMEAAERLGLVKFDFLGLKERDVIDYAQELIGQQCDWSYDDEATYAYISTGRTKGMFQVGSQGFQEMLPKMQPTEFAHLIAAVALYRPGPIDGGMLEDFIERMHGRQPITYPHPDLEEELEETYGVVVYQEQVMHIAQIIAGYTLGEADILRRAMSKKKTKEMNKQKPKFLGQAQDRGYSQSLAEDLWGKIQKFSDYGFNKSHAAAYADLTYKTAYLKTHHRAALIAAQMDVRHGDAETVSSFVREANREDIPVREPDVQASGYQFTADEEAIQVGLCAIKGLNNEVAHAVADNAPYEDIPDLLLSVPDMSQGDLKKLVTSGALDSLLGAETLDEKCYFRASLFDRIDPLMSATDGYDDDSQGELFSAQQVGVSFDPTHLPQDDAWGALDLAHRENEALGRYRTFHPAEKLKESYSRVTDICDWKDLRVGQTVTLCGVIRAVSDYETKNGNMMGFVLFADETGEADIVVMPDEWDPSVFTEGTAACYPVERQKYEGDPTLRYACNSQPQQTNSQMSVLGD